VTRMDTPVDEARDLCANPVDTLEDCRKLVSAPSDPGAPIVAQCRTAIASVEAREAAHRPRADYGAALRGELPPHMAQVGKLIRTQLSALPWRRPPVVVLLPMHG